MIRKPLIPQPARLPRSHMKMPLFPLTQGPLSEYTNTVHIRTRSRPHIYNALRYPSFTFLDRFRLSRRSIPYLLLYSSNSTMLRQPWIPMSVFLQPYLPSSGMAYTTTIVLTSTQLPCFSRRTTVPAPSSRRYIFFYAYPPILSISPEQSLFGTFAFFHL